MKLIASLFTAAALCSAVPLFAADAEKGKTPAKSEKPAAPAGEAAKSKPLPLIGTVVAVTTRTLTLKGGEGKEDRKFTINKGTTILKGDTVATTEGVKIGQSVTGSYVKNAEGPGTLLKLQIAPKPAPAKKTAKTVEGTTKKTEGETKKKAG
jgi:hypothetical protein